MTRLNIPLLVQAIAAPLVVATAGISAGAWAAIIAAIGLLSGVFYRAGRNSADIHYVKKEFAASVVVLTEKVDKILVFVDDATEQRVKDASHCARCETRIDALEGQPHQHHRAND